MRRISPDGTITAVGDVVESATNLVSGLTTTPDGTVLAATADAAGTTQMSGSLPMAPRRRSRRPAGWCTRSRRSQIEQVATLTDSSVDRVDLSTGVATPTGQTAALLGQSLAAAPDGTLVGDIATNHTFRMAPDNTPDAIAGNGTGDPGTTAQHGDSSQLKLTATGLALTPNDGVLLSSGHVIYHFKTRPARRRPSVAISLLRRRLLGHLRDTSVDPLDDPFVSPCPYAPTFG